MKSNSIDTNLGPEKFLNEPSRSVRKQADRETGRRDVGKISGLLAREQEQKRELKKNCKNMKMLKSESWVKK